LTRATARFLELVSPFAAPLLGSLNEYSICAQHLWKRRSSANGCTGQSISFGDCGQLHGCGLKAKAAFCRNEITSIDTQRFWFLLGSLLIMSSPNAKKPLTK